MPKWTSQRIEKKGGLDLKDLYQAIAMMYMLSGGVKSGLAIAGQFGLTETGRQAKELGGLQLAEQGAKTQSALTQTGVMQNLLQAIGGAQGREAPSPLTAQLGRTPQIGAETLRGQTGLPSLTGRQPTPAMTPTSMLAQTQPRGMTPELRTTAQKWSALNQPGAFAKDIGAMPTKPPTPQQQLDMTTTHLTNAIKLIPVSPEQASRAFKMAGFPISPQKLGEYGVEGTRTLVTEIAGLHQDIIARKDITPERIGTSFDTIVDAGVDAGEAGKWMLDAMGDNSKYRMEIGKQLAKGIPAGQKQITSLISKYKKITDNERTDISTRANELVNTLNMTPPSAVSQAYNEIVRPGREEEDTRLDLLEQAQAKNANIVDVKKHPKTGKWYAIDKNGKEYWIQQ